MELFEKVVKGLECHSSQGKCASNCPYMCSGCCSEPLANDALIVIQRQQDKIKELEEAANGFDTGAQVAKYTLWANIQRRLYIDGLMTKELLEFFKRHTPDELCAKER